MPPKIDSSPASYESVATLIDQIHPETEKSTVRSLCAQAYARLRAVAVVLRGKLPAEERLLLFRVLELYAGRVCYGRTVNGDEEAGFRESARLAELSFCLQLKALGLGNVGYDWAAILPLIDLLTAFRSKRTKKGFCSTQSIKANMIPRFSSVRPLMQACEGSWQRR